jgi:hypothetical protein
MGFGSKPVLADSLKLCRPGSKKSMSMVVALVLAAGQNETKNLILGLILQNK